MSDPQMPTRCTRTIASRAAGWLGSSISMRANCPGFSSRMALMSTHSAGFEPATGGLEIHCSIQLSYECSVAQYSVRIIVLHIEQEVRDIPILHHIRLPLSAHLSGRFDVGLSLVILKIFQL